ncbi:flotillin-2 [Nilaparvata lugens]|uniref:flotillin-2 n=1 Tax=Nilaparvata lugens TaxID=108931 RepID=UPI00193D5DA4|nr:flotillin-2 [Nilaparvata lugens]
MEKELRVKVQMPADAESYKVQKIAEGEREKALKASLAEGNCIKMKGEAVAIVTEKVGKAQALEMKMKSNVYNKYSKSAITQLVLTSLPKIAAEISAPLNKVEEMLLVFNDEDDIGEDIFDKILTKLENTPDILKVVEETIKELLGLEQENKV